MPIGGLFKRLTSLGESTADFAEDAFERAGRPAAVLAPAARSMREKATQAILHRDELIDARTRIAGYRFYVRSPPDAAPLAASDIIDALKAEAVYTFAQRRLALIPLSLEEWRAADYRALIAAHTVFALQVPMDDGERAAWLEGVREMRAAGARIAMQGMDATPRFAEALACCQMALLDFRDYSLAAFERLVHGLRARHPEVAIAVDNVSSWPERRLCAAQGVDYCLGAFAALRDEDDLSEQLNQSRVVLIELLNLLRTDADVAALTAAAKRDPGVALQVLSMANSPAAGMTRSVASLEQAMLVLGREQLYRWTSIALFRAGSVRARDETLLELALARGRFLELIARASGGQRHADELFLVGLFSLLDCLLGMPMPAILERFSLPRPVEDVLLRSEGAYARHLALAIAVERGRSAQWSRLAVALGVDPGDIQAATVAALAGAEDAMRRPGSGA